MRALPALVAALLLAACGRETPPSAAAPPTLAEAGAATYASDYVARGALTLDAGHYADDDLVRADLDTLSAHGDLDGDGREERVVLLVTASGGTGVFRDLYVLWRTPPGIRVSPPAMLGDRVEVTDLRIAGGEVIVDLVVQGADDPLCCPTLAVTYRFRLAGGELVETTGQRRVFLKE